MAADTKTTLLDAAEQLFAENGFAATSLRAITAEAGVNLAAVNYHFGSKEELIKAVLARWIEPLNDERFELLAAAEARGELTLEPVVASFIAPALRLGGDADRATSLKRLMGRMLAEQAGFLDELMRERFGAVVDRYMAALCGLLPHLAKRDLSWRFFFMVGSMAHTMQCAEQLRSFTDGVCDPDDVDAMVERMVAFCCAGLRAPASALEQEDAR